MDRLTRQLFGLLRCGLWGAAEDSALFEDKVEWMALYDLAASQGVDGVCFEGIELRQAQISETADESSPGEMDLDSLMEWFGQVQYLTADYRKHRRALESLAGFYAEEGIKMILLKGYGLSKYWPVPEHRPVGDIDIYLGDRWSFADRMVQEKLGIKIDSSQHHHTVFRYKGVSVENHYDFLNTKSKRSNAAFDKRLKELIGRGGELADAEMANVYYPSAQFNALFLARHCASHFSSTEMTLRQLLDWLLFVKANRGSIDWEELYGDLRRFNLDRFVNSMNAIGVKYLGFDADMFPAIEGDERLVERVLNDILDPEFKEKEDGTLLRGLWVKPRRWWHNRWKHEICSPDSMWSAFWYGVWAKVLKPGHFRW